MIVTIHQPEHLPWLGFFDKLRRADCWVILDHVQYRKRYFQNRNQVRSSAGPVWLTAPVRVKGRFDQPICDVEIDNEGQPRWAQKCWQTLSHCYTRAPHFREHAPFFADVYARRWDRLVDLNVALIAYLLDAFSIPVRIVRSSEMSPSSAKGELMLELTRAAGGSTYLSGISGREYLQDVDFSRAGIGLEIQEFHHPVYAQQHEPFLPCMSAVDLLFNHGPESRHLLEGADIPRLDHVFE